MTRRLQITAADIPGLRRRLANPTPVLKSIGARMVAASQKAFEDQSYGGERWPERYEGGPEPFINVAGALSDMNRGKPIKARRFERRPAAQDTREMFNKLSFELVGKKVVRAGSTAPHAAAQHFGLEVTQPVTEVARDRLRKEHKKYKRRGGAEFDAVKRLGFLHSVPTLTTQIHARPHVGLYPDLEREIVAEVEEFIAEG